jgi:hypothetical protein
MPKMETWEMIKKLTENPKLQARGSARGHISMTVAINEFGSLVEAVSGEIPTASSFVTLTHDVLSVYDWELVSQPVPFMDAAKIYKVTNTPIYGVRKDGTRVYFSESILGYRGDTTFRLDDIMNAVWYVEE